VIVGAPASTRGADRDFMAGGRRGHAQAAEVSDLL
jgi:hypothetical protein